MDRSSIFLKSQLVPIYWVPNGWVVLFFCWNSVSTTFVGTKWVGGPFFSLNSVSTHFLGTKWSKWVVPYYFFKISVGTGYQNGWSPLIFSKIQLVPGTKRGGPLWFFPNFSWYQVPKWVGGPFFSSNSVGTQFWLWVGTQHFDPPPALIVLTLTPPMRQFYYW